MDSLVPVCVFQKRQFHKLPVSIRLSFCPQTQYSLVPRPPLFFVLRFPVFCSSVCVQYSTWTRKSTVSSASMYYTEHKLKNKKWGRPKNEARHNVSPSFHNACLSQLSLPAFKLPFCKNMCPFYMT